MKTEDEILKEAKRCYYYGCAGTRICTYEPFTTHCPYPNCDKPGYGKAKIAYLPKDRKASDLLEVTTKK